MRSALDNKHVSVKRTHGLGNVLLLLPVLDQLHARGAKVHLTTRMEWAPTFQTLRPGMVINDLVRPDTIDLDELTLTERPGCPRTAEFSRLLGVEDVTTTLELHIPDHWREPFLCWRGALGFAPEAGHPSRQWPSEYSFTLAGSLLGSPLVLIGSDRHPAYPCDFDSRGTVKLDELFGLLSILQGLICMDSGVLHMAAAVGTPTIAVFGGIDPKFRIRATDRVLALRANLDCCPCNKVETCKGEYHCIRATTPEVVAAQVGKLSELHRRSIRRT